RGQTGALAIGTRADHLEAYVLGVLHWRQRTRRRVSGLWREARARAVAEFRAVDGAGLRPVPTRAPRSDGFGQGGMSPRRAMIHRLALGTSGATLILIAAGGIVTSTGVGLAVPDWPTTFGHNMLL